MERCDFSSVITIIRKYISEDRNLNQIDLLYELFDAFLCDESSRDFDFDNGLVCRWFNGQARISPRISSFYLDGTNRKRLAEDIERNVLPLMYDSAMAVQEVYQLLVQDSSISDRQKGLLIKCLSSENDRDEAAFLAELLCFCMERSFWKRNARTREMLAAGRLSPVVKDFVYDSSVSKPCRYFCGREEELFALHERLCETGKIFLQGIAGIGKSELAKAYASRYSREYTNILYLTYSSDLKQLITEMDFADDLPGDSEEERFRRHNRFLRSLKEDTLLIVDNFNVTAAQDSLLPVVMKYRCHVLFTTRSRFDHYTSMELKEISDRETLLQLMGCFFSEAQKYRPILEQMIEAVHAHTLAVELAARLLESGILKPEALLSKLQKEKTALDDSDTIGIIKDGENRKATYYDHIHTLFSLYQLSGPELDVMRNMTFAPTSGISGRLIAGWMGLQDMNTINDLVEKGFVQIIPGHMVTLHPLIQEITVDETRPSVHSCRSLLSNLQEICLRHGEDISYYKQLFEIIENMMELAEKDDLDFYLRFLEDVYPYIDKYSDYRGMTLVLDDLSSLVEKQGIGTAADRALLLEYRASLEAQPEKAVRLVKEALALLPDTTEDNALLAANLWSNLGGFYKKMGELQKAKQSMEQGIQILEQYELTAYHDCISQIANYAVLLNDLGENVKALNALKKLDYRLRHMGLENTLDYAMVQEALGGVYLTKRDKQQATFYFQKAMEIYEVQFESRWELVVAKRTEMFEAFKRAGFSLIHKA